MKVIYEGVLMPNRAYFVIADITGYTAFLTGSELEHAQDILKSLFDTLLDNIKAPLTISNFQGDAILTYAPEGSFVLGQTLLESVENIYCAFSHKLELMHRNTTCTCRACANIPKLDLKLFVHFGEYLLQDMRGKAELSGPDVIIAHRMMKNEVKEKTGLKAYTLFSEVAVNQLGLQDFTCEMHPHSETYDHIGEVKMYAYCLKTMWEHEREKRRDIVNPQEAWFVYDHDIPASPATVWDYYTEPQRKVTAYGVDGITVSAKNAGRMGVGSITHCAHGSSSKTDFLVLDWKPFEYITEKITGLPMGMMGRTTLHLTPTEAGTHVAVRFDYVTGINAVSKFMANIMRPMMKGMLVKDYTKIFTNMRQLILDDIASGKLVVEAPVTQQQVVN
jgi:hypothetical protein